MAKMEKEVPIPCTNVKEKTIRQWFAKLDEEVTEFKAAILSLYNLDDDIVAVYDDVPELNEELNCRREDIALEGADVCTVVHSMNEQIGIDFENRMVAQFKVNQSNWRLGRHE